MGELEEKIEGLNQCVKNFVEGLSPQEKKDARIRVLRILNIASKKC